MLGDIEKAASLAQKVGRRLTPPKSDDSTVNAWRWFIVAITTANTVGLAVHIILACGLTPWFGGFAHASEQESTKEQVLATRIEQIEWRMFELRVKQCEAIDKGESPLAFTVQLEQQMKRYRELAKSMPHLPDCNQIG